MSAKTGLIVALVGGLLLHASGARADENVLEPPSPPEPRMVHKPWSGLVVAGVAIAAPAYLLQMLSTLGYSATIQTYDQPCSYCAKAQALTLIPIAGPWLAARAAGTPDDKGALLFGGIEAAAVAMIIVGLVGHDVPAEPEGSKVSLAPFATPQAGGLSLRMRW
jgi:hypothetical protein